jgi:hypothetical protein
MTDKPKHEMTAYKQRRAAGDVAFGERHKRLAELMMFGLDGPSLRLPGVNPGRPLSLEEAARALGVKLRNARQIFRTPGFQALYAELRNEVRTGATARALRKVIELVDWQGEGRAADAKICLEAAKTILGEPEQGVSVNVQVNNQLGVAFRPGYVICLPAEIDQE